LKWFSKSCPKSSRGARLPACEWRRTKSKREGAENAEGFAEKYLDWTILIRHSCRRKNSALATISHWLHIKFMKNAATFTARIVRDGKWFIAFSPEFPEGNGQGLTEEEALASLRESILLLLEDRREDARASLGNGEKLIPLALA
jgi:predicted RNase H-like HicB family nuclease